jgi:peptidoglycan/LPS O-acetylase OafA/YrhL
MFIRIGQGGLTKETWIMGNRMEENAGALSYMPQLDALRAFAVGGVLLAHYTGLQMVATGALGVRLFFVLSGFLITRILLKARERARSQESSLHDQLRVFYARRALRLFPPLLLFVAAAVVFGIESMRTTWPWHVSYLSNVYFARRGTWEGPLSPLWSLSVEEQFYLAWPIFILLAPARKLIPVISLAIGSAVAFRVFAAVTDMSSIARTVLPFASLDALGLGGLLAIAVERPASGLSPRLLRLGRVVGIPGFFLVITLRMFGIGGAVDTVLGDSFVALAFMWLVGNAAGGSTGAFGRMLESPVLVYLGTISYGIYLYHTLAPGLIGWFFSAIGQIGGPLAFWSSAFSGSFQSTLVPLTMLVSNVLVAIGMASASWFLLEHPLSRLRRKIQYTSGGRPGRKHLPSPRDATATVKGQQSQ